MIITESQIRRIIRETISLEKTANSRWDLQVLQALENDDIQRAAQLISDNNDPLDLGAVLEDIKFSWPEFRDIVSRKPEIFRNYGPLEKAVMDASISRRKSTMQGSKFSKELQALAAAFSNSVMAPDEVTMISYQPRRSGPAVTKIYMNHREEGTSDMDDSFAQQHGTTLANVIKALDFLGAKKRLRSPARKSYSSYYD